MVKKVGKPDNQMNLFAEEKISSDGHALSDSSNNSNPLAFKLRPDSFENFFGQQHLFARFKFLTQTDIPSLILWGPPGTGKTTLAMILAKRSGRELYPFNAVLGGVNDLRKLIDRALEMKLRHNIRPVIFIDEIHRFNKAQQDALLPYVEAGDFTLMGATTENPRSSVNRALLSRVQILPLKPLGAEAIYQILQKAKNSYAINVEDEDLIFISERASGDARKALNTLDAIWNQSKQQSISHEDLKNLILENCRDYDRNQNRHYDVISAFIKSMRGSDPDAAILWLAVMLDGGEDPVFIGRRLVIFASEDVGNADPWALNIAMNALFAVQNIGMPEAKITLAQATTYLASTVKSNASYEAINKALEYVENSPTLEVPEHLKNYPDNYIAQKYAPEKLNLYNPSNNGRESVLKQRLENLNKKSQDKN
ncbi:MAG: replication-associated recombination protein A [Bacteriovoracia bacterium]